MSIDKQAQHLSAYTCTRSAHNCSFFVDIAENATMAVDQNPQALKHMYPGSLSNSSTVAANRYALHALHASVQQCHGLTCKGVAGA